METTEKSILCAHWVKIIDNLDPGDIVNQLFQDGVLEQDDIDKIRSKNIRSEKCVTLLEILMRRGPERKPFEYFLNSLSEKYEYLYQSIIDSFDSIYEENYTKKPCENDDRNASRLNGGQENTWIENLKEPPHTNTHAFESWCETDFANPVFCQNTNIWVEDQARQTELKSTGEQVVVSGKNEISQNFDKTKREPEQTISPLIKITKTVSHAILNILTSFAFVRFFNVCVSILSIINACIVILCLFMCIVLIPIAIIAQVLAYAGMLLIKIQISGLKMIFKLLKIISSHVFKMLGNTLCMLYHYTANTGISCFRMFRMILDKAAKLILRITCIVSMCLYSAVLMAIIIAILSAGTSRKGAHRLMSHCLDILKFIRKSVLSFIACAIQSTPKSICASYKWVFDKIIGLWLWFMFSKSICASYKWVFHKTISLLLWFMFSFFVYGTKEKGSTTHAHYLSVKECVILLFGATLAASIVYLTKFVYTVAMFAIFITGSLVVAFLLIRDRRNDMNIGYKPRCA